MKSSIAASLVILFVLIGIAFKPIISKIGAKNKEATTITSNNPARDGSVEPSSKCPEKNSDFGKQTPSYKICYATVFYKPAISDSQVTSIIGAITKSFFTCLKSSSAMPKNCPLAVSNAKSVISIRWHFVEPPKVRFESGDSKFIYASVEVAYTATGTMVKNGKRVKISAADGSIGDNRKARVSISNSNYQVTWE